MVSDIDLRNGADVLTGSPRQPFLVQVNNPADYTVWVRGMAPDAAGDSAHIGLNNNFNDNVALTGFTNQWSWSRQTMSNTQASLPLTSSGVYTIDLAMREDGLWIDRMLLVTDTNYIPSGIGPAESAFEVISNTTTAELTSHVIHYNYDDVYRLTDAIYTGDITATYQYSYDSVGNMTAYTETLGTQTSRVTRTFDDANRLQASFDYDAGTTSYLYDNNGNLTLIIPPDGGNWLHYGFDQRNLMVSHTLALSGTNPQLQAEYAYDGAGNRIQQVDYTGASPVTTTYANDITGLTQVLVADDGAEQVYNLFGLDLIGQDDEASVHYLLADGLGSVRTEMVDGTVESVTTYDPYGNLLTQTGDSGTTYGYTGEQHDEATDLLYLRARYYNPALRSFMERDPWSGNRGSPQSMNGWSYVEENPVNLVDLSGMIPEVCKRGMKNKVEYALCLGSEYDVDVNFSLLIQYENAGYSSDIKFDEIMNAIEDHGNGCYTGAIPYRGPGYIEGSAMQWSGDEWYGGGNWSFATGGAEMIYNFAKLERTAFKFYGNYTSDNYPAGWSISEYVSSAVGFRSWWSTADDTQGTTYSFSYGIALLNAISELGVSAGMLRFNTPPHILGHGFYVGVGLGAFDILPGFEYTNSETQSKPLAWQSYVNPDDTVMTEKMIAHILEGDSSPWKLNLLIGFSYIPSIGNLSKTHWVQAVEWAKEYSCIYEDMHRGTSTYLDSNGTCG